MRVGLVGFSGSGKSILFQLLTGATPDPGKVHSGQVGVAHLVDPRLDFLKALHKPKKVTPATVELLDTPGLIPGSHGDNPQRLALIREGDALLVVSGAFAGSNPADDLAGFRDELLFADLSVVANRIERLSASSKKPRPDREAQLKELELIQRVYATLEAGEPISTLGLSEGGEETDAVVWSLDRQAASRAPERASQGEEIPPALLAVAPDTSSSMPNSNSSSLSSTPRNG